MAVWAVFSGTRDRYEALEYVFLLAMCGSARPGSPTRGLPDGTRHLHRALIGWSAIYARSSRRRR
jgi:hypothetical protein